MACRLNKRRNNLGPDQNRFHRFSDERDKYRHRITAENCLRGNEELIKNFYHRGKGAVEKG